MNNDDKKLLAELCSQHQVSFEKVIKLLNTAQDFEFQGRRTGIYSALHDIVKSSFSKKVQL